MGLTSVLVGELDAVDPAEVDDPDGLALVFLVVLEDEPALVLRQAHRVQRCVAADGVARAHVERRAGEQGLQAAVEEGLEDEGVPEKRILADDN